MVYVAKNIRPYSEVIDDHTIEGYEYEYVCYDKDEYIHNLTVENNNAILQLQKELETLKSNN